MIDRGCDHRGARPVILRGFERGERVGLGFKRAQRGATHRALRVGAVVIKTAGDGFRLLVLHFPHAAKVVVTIRTHGGIRGAVDRAAGVVVNDGLIVEVDDIQCAVGANAVFDRAEPQVLAAHELGFLATGLFVSLVADSLLLDELVMHDVERGFGGEVAVVPLRGPRAAFIDGATGGGGEIADLVDLHIGLLRPRHGGEGLLAADHAFPARGAGDFAFGQHILRQHDVEEHGAAGGLREEHLAVGGDVEAPSVAAA
ncbi:unannotated protein [freshwater metagenome]|uniref:Unannotated protein n=1 Tax=freshwater metagenome TaxID=449393 RepID=A0A6J6F6A0_9ZZZZ